MTSHPFQWLDPTGRFQRELDAALVHLTSQRATIQQMEAELQSLQTQAGLQGKRTWFGPAPNRTEIEARRKQREARRMEGKLELERSVLADLEADYEDMISPPLYAEGRTWTFDEANDLIIQLLDQISRTLRERGQVKPPKLPTKFAIPKELASSEEPKEDLNIDLHEVVPFLSAMMSTVADVALEKFDSKRRKFRGVKLYRLILHVEHLHKERRRLLPSYYEKIKTWDTPRLNSELRRWVRQLEGTDIEIIGIPSAASDYSIPITNPFVEQRRFVQQIIDELNVAIERSQQPSPAISQTRGQAKIAKIGALMKERDDLKQKSNQAVWPDIDRVYGQLIDEERRKP